MTKTCTLDDCSRPHKGRGLCDMHIQRLRRTGTTASPVRSLAERFWEKVAKAGPDDCWLWTAALNEHGYGVMRPEERRSGPAVKAHRVSAELAGMEIHGLMVRHRCDNPPCVNPAHLEPGDAADNVGDMIARGRIARGERRSVKLTDDAVREIRQRVAAGELQREVAAAFGITRSNVSLIAAGKAWAHVSDSLDGAA